MLNNLFRPPVSRIQYDTVCLHLKAANKERDMVKAELAVVEQERANAMDQVIDLVAQRDKAISDRDWARTQCDEAVKERDDAHEEYTAAATRELAARDIAIRALNLLQKVDTTRTGGAKLREARNTLMADAMLAGLWREVKE